MSNRYEEEAKISIECRLKKITIRERDSILHFDHQGNISTEEITIPVDKETIKKYEPHVGKLCAMFIIPFKE